MVNPVILIPARLGSTRLPGKPLADIHGEPMIVHVWRRASEAAIGPVVVAAAESEIVEAIEHAGGRAMLTRPDHSSGSDRIFEALSLLDPGRRYDVIVNVQGDLPLIDPNAIRAALEPLTNPACDIATIAAPIADPAELADPNVVKVAADFRDGMRIAAARLFGRTVASDAGSQYHHIGLYAYRRAALERFVKLPLSAREKSARLEQLRAVDDGMRIDVALVDAVPFGVDTPADLERARALMRARQAPRPR